MDIISAQKVSGAALSSMPRRPFCGRNIDFPAAKFAKPYRASVTEEQKPSCDFIRVILFGRFGSCDLVHMHKKQFEL
jgi:hypothetical protein